MGKREENKKIKQRAILEAALAVFAEKGFASAKISEVARTANVGKGTIYEYYQSKEDLFFAVFQWYVEEMVSASMVDAAKLGGNEADRLRTFLDSAVESAAGTLEYFAISLEFWAASGNPTTRDRFRGAMLGLYESFRQVMAGLIADGKNSGVFRESVKPQAVAAGFMGALDGLMLQAWMDESFDIRAVAADFMDTVMNGMLTWEKKL